MSARARNRRNRERAYLDAAMAIATRDGIDALTMQRLADAVDAAVGTVYTYFPSKGALVAELQRVAIERLMASYHQLRDRSDAVLADWDDPAARAVARLVVFGRFWVASVGSFPEESSLLHGLISETRTIVPPEERHRVLPTALAMLVEARDAIAAADAAGGLSIDDATGAVIRWAASLTGVLLTANFADGSPIEFDAAALANQLSHDLLLGWSVAPEVLARAERHVDDLALTGPLAPVGVDALAAEPAPILRDVPGDL